eukprot:1643233-Pleurochrysis_carterae.AAC.1
MGWVATRREEPSLARNRHTAACEMTRAQATSPGARWRAIDKYRKFRPQNVSCLARQFRQTGRASSFALLRFVICATEI